MAGCGIKNRVREALVSLMDDFLCNGLFIAVTVTFPILVVLVQIKLTLDEIRETQEKTNRLLRQYLTDERDGVE
jgi:hypothetical protein